MSKIRIVIEENKAITPPNLLGIERKIAYANRKYHSGWIWIGVTNGLAIMKLSGSLRLNGKIKEMNINKNTLIINPKESLIEKYGWNGILSRFLFVPKGLFDPVWWRNIRCKITKNRTINGRIKCKAKNRFKVGLSTANPPQIQNTIMFPIYGIAEIKFVITVAPQKDICPHGSTYPRNADAIVRIKIKIPIVQVSLKIEELK